MHKIEPNSRVRWKARTKFRRPEAIKLGQLYTVADVKLPMIRLKKNIVWHYADAFEVVS